MNQHNLRHLNTNDFPSLLPDIHPDKQALTSLVNSVETREPNLIGHGARTAWYALQLGRAIHLHEHDLEHLLYAAYLHDVGKLSIPEEILIKENPLSSQEYHQLQSHPSAAITLLESWPYLRLPSIWIAHHHERWDGSGYPNGLKGTYIPLGSRIIAIADTYDVLTLRNLDEPGIGSENCLSTLRWYSGSHFDPELIDIFSKRASEWTTFREWNVVPDDLSTVRVLYKQNPPLTHSDRLRHDTPKRHQALKGNYSSLQPNPLSSVMT